MSIQHMNVRILTGAPNQNIRVKARPGVKLTQDAWKTNENDK